MSRNQPTVSPITIVNNKIVNKQKNNDKTKTNEGKRALSTSSTPPSSQSAIIAKKTKLFVTPNRYEALIADDDNPNPDNENIDNDNQHETPSQGQSNTTHDTPKPILSPPVFIKGVLDYIGLRNSIRDLIGPTSFSCKSSTAHLKIQTDSPDNYRKLIRLLKDINAQYHTYQLHSEKSLRIVVKNLHPTTPVEDIAAAIEEIGHSVKNVINIRHHQTKSPLPMFFVDLNPQESDLNAKNILWGCCTNNPRGNTLHNLSQQNNYKIYAPSSPTYCPTSLRKRPDILDIFVMKIPNSLHNTLTNLDDLCSDHSAVLLTIDTAASKKPNKPSLTQGRMDWEAFRTQLVNHIDLKTRLKSTQDIDDAVHTLTTSIQQAAWSSSTIPNPLNKPTSDLPHFVRTLISEKRKARAVWQRTKYPSDKRLFNHLTNKLKRILAKIKSDNLTNHLASLSTTDNSLWQNTRKILRSQPPVPPLRNPDGTWLISDLEKANAFRHHLYTTFQPHIDIIPSNKIVDVDHFLSSPLPMTLPPKHIRPSEVEFIINKSARHKTPGYDLITSEVASQLPRKAILSLTHIYNSMLRLSYFPLLWKFSIIIMILKPGKPADSPSSYRPISLLPFFSKVFEKLTLKRLLPIIDTNLPDNQFGFRNNHSTIHQVHRIVDKISYSLEKKLICTGAFLDVAQAFKVNISSQLLLNLQVISRRQAFLRTIWLSPI
ncbi:hypothetical protein QTP88_027466 [Uroleucon formosanum]